MAEKNETKTEFNSPVGRRMGGPRFGPVEKPKNFKGSIRRLWRYFGAEKYMLSVIFVFLIIDSVILLFGPYLNGRAIDAMTSGIGHVGFGSLRKAAIALAAVYVADVLLTFGENFLMASTSQRIVKSLRKELFAKLQSLPISFFDTHTHGDLMSRFTNDIDNISTTISQSVVSLMSDVISIVGSLIMMLVLSPMLTLASLITAPLVLVLSRTISKKTRVLFKRQQAALGELNGHIEESVSGIQVVKAFNRENMIVEEFEEKNAKLLKVSLKAQILSGYMMPLMNVISNLGFAAIAGFGGVLAVKGLITVGVIASFLNYSKQFTRPLNDIANIYNTLQTAVAGAERIFEISDEKEEVSDQRGAMVMENPIGDVVFDHVSFGYKPGVDVLKDISFHVNAAQNIALVGPTGAGKTTVVNLVNRFYDVTGGSIKIDGEDVKSYTRNSLRSSFGIVLQDTYLFSGTIKDNIRYGRLDATDEQLKQAAVTSGADTFIRRLEDGYDTQLSESGGGLSEGQRQLISIARAVLKNPPILILDEATSSVDTRTEMHIQQAMQNLMHGRTCFIIAHRLSTIRDADVIMVIDGGHLVEKGRHEELLEAKGYYYKLYTSQFNNIAT